MKRKIIAKELQIKKIQDIGGCRIIHHRKNYFSIESNARHFRLLPEKEDLVMGIGSGFLPTLMGKHVDKRVVKPERPVARDALFFEALPKPVARKLAEKASKIYPILQFLHLSEK